MGGKQMNMNLTVEEIIGFYFIKDAELGLIGRSILNKKFGKESAELLYKACKAKNEPAAEFYLSGVTEGNTKNIDQFADAAEYVKKCVENKPKRIAETTLFKMIKSDNNDLVQKGKEYFCKYNRNYVYQMIHRNYDSYVKDSLDFDDFVQEAMAEMLKSLESFDP